MAKIFCCICHWIISEISLLHIITLMIEVFGKKLEAFCLSGSNSLSSPKKLFYNNTNLSKLLKQLCLYYNKKQQKFSNIYITDF